MNRMIKRYLGICIIALAVLGITARAFSATGTLEDKCYQAEVVDISGAKYFPAVSEELAKAEKSIYMVMYFAKFDPQERRSRVYGLVEELVNAHKRGVKVKVILDQGLDFSTLRETVPNGR